MAEHDSIIVNNRIIGSGIDLMLHAKAVAVANVNTALDLDGSSIDGVTVNAGDIVLLTAQTSAVDNGMYEIVAGAGNSRRSADLFDGATFNKKFVSIEQGTAYGDTTWHVKSTGVAGTNAMNWAQTSFHDYVAGDIFYALDSGKLAKLAAPSTASLLEMNASGSPTWTDKNDITAGLDPKESVQWGTIDPITGTYSAGGGTGGTGAFTGVDLTDVADFDLGGGGPIAIGDRIIIKNQLDAKQNGIYVVTTAGAAGAIERASDHDGSPASEVSAGNFTFVEQGSILANTGWIVQGQGQLTLNSDDIDWTQFNGAGNFTGGDGIDITGNAISLDALANGGIVFSSGEAAVDLGASAITGTLAVGSGGTGVTSIASGSLIIGNGTSAVNTLAPTARKVLTTSSAPAYQLSNTVNLSQINGASDDLALVKFSPVGSAVKEFTISNSIAGGNPILETTSSTQANVGMILRAKGTGTFDFKTTSAAGEIRLFEATASGTNYVGLKAGTIGTDLTFTLPIADGSNGDLVSTDGSGNLGFTTLADLNKPNLAITTRRYVATSASYRTVAYFSYDVSRLGASKSCNFFYYVEITGSNLDVDVRNALTLANIVSDTNIGTSAFRSLSFTSPAVDTVFQIRIKKTTGAGANPRIGAIHLQIN